MVFGGVGINPQIDSAAQGTDILVATPGRLLDLMNQGHVNLKHVEILVLDEGQTVYEHGFYPRREKIIAALPNKRQTLFSRLLHAAWNQKDSHPAFCTNPFEVSVTPVSSTGIPSSNRFVLWKRRKRYLWYTCSIPMTSSTLWYLHVQRVVPTALWRIW